MDSDSESSWQDENSDREIFCVGIPWISLGEGSGKRIYTDRCVANCWIFFLINCPSWAIFIFVISSWHYFALWYVWRFWMLRQKKCFYGGSGGFVSLFLHVSPRNQNVIIQKSLITTICVNIFHQSMTDRLTKNTAYTCYITHLSPLQTLKVTWWAIFCIKGCLLTRTIT